MESAKAKRTENDRIMKLTIELDKERRKNQLQANANRAIYNRMKNLERAFLRIGGSLKEIEQAEQERNSDDENISDNNNADSDRS